MKVVNLNVSHIFVKTVFNYTNNDWISQCSFIQTKSFYITHITLFIANRLIPILQL